MNKNTITKLNKINKDFYNLVAKDFNESRKYSWEGWKNINPYIEHFKDLKLLDVGSGNSRFYEYISKSFPNTYVEYQGVDNNKALLKIAQKKFSMNHGFKLKNVDLINSLTKMINFINEENFNLIISFGVMHHIPSYNLRVDLLKYLKRKLAKKGIIIISLWQFLKYERFKRKIVKKDVLQQIELNDLEENDFILDWKRGKTGLRYCHFTDKEEQLKLIKDAELKLVASFEADGLEGDLNTYLILENFN